MFLTIVALCVGIAIGAALATGLARRRRPGREVAEASSVSEVLAATEAAGDSLDPVNGVLRQAADLFVRGVVICDADATIVYRNRAALALGGTHAGVLLEDQLEALMSAALAHGSADRRLELHGPPRVSFEITASAMANGCAVATIEDVSERSRIDAMRTDFVANISHELKTPVGAIAVLAEALADESDPAVIERLSGRLVDESHRAVTTIDDLLELSRIESARLDDEVIDVGDVVSLAISRSAGVDPDKDITVSAHDGGVAVYVRGDRTQLASAIGNLVENAVKYSDPGGVVQVRTRVDERWVEVMVADHGPGIPARDLDRIFERFYRVDRARSRTTGGSGLGLSIVRHVANNHGGEVLVSSQEGEGSTFVLRLPASLLVDPGPDPDVVAEIPSHPGSTGGLSTPSSLKETRS